MILIEYAITQATIKNNVDIQFLGHGFKLFIIQIIKQDK